MIQRIVAVIGTAGRGKQLTSKHWEYMQTALLSTINKEDTLISGGAAWADHLAVWAYLNNYCEGLILHLPAPFENGKFVGEYKTAGGTANYYHRLMTKELGISTLRDIELAIGKGAKVTSQAEGMDNRAMFARNTLVAKDCTHMVAFTFGVDGVVNGGTKHTWELAKDKPRRHYSLEGTTHSCG